MSVFDNIGNKLSNIGGSIKQSATTFTETMQLNSNIEKANKDLRDTFTELGKKFFNENKENVPEQYRDVFARINDINAYIENTKQQVRNLTGVRECPNCKSDVQKGQFFCTVCGTRVAEESQNERRFFCRNCGKEIQPGFAFCNFCGTKVEDAWYHDQKEMPPENVQSPEQNAYVRNEYVKPSEPQITEPEYVKPSEMREEQRVYDHTEYIQPQVTEQENVQPAETKEEQPEFVQYSEQYTETEMSKETDTSDISDDRVICPQCGAKIKSGTTFCIMCGSRLK